METRDPKDPEMIYVYFLEGTHGTGKTTIIEALKRIGFMTISEDFMDKYSGFLSSPEHTFLTEAAWAGDCLNKVIEKANELRSYRELGHGSFRGDSKTDRYCELPPIIFVDRSYITGLIYGALKDLYLFDDYKQLCEEVIFHLPDKYYIQPRFVRIKPANEEQHINLVLDRATDNSTRQQLNELDIDFLKLINKKYDAYEADESFNYIYINSFKKKNDDGYVKVDLAPFLDVIHELKNYPDSLESLVVSFQPDE